MRVWPVVTLALLVVGVIVGLATGLWILILPLGGIAWLGSRKR